MQWLQWANKLDKVENSTIKSSLIWHGPTCLVTRTTRNTKLWCYYVSFPVFIPLRCMAASSLYFRCYTCKYHFFNRKYTGISRLGSSCNVYKTSSARPCCIKYSRMDGERLHFNTTGSALMLSFHYMKTSKSRNIFHIQKSSSNNNSYNNSSA